MYRTEGKCLKKFINRIINSDSNKTSGLDERKLQ